MLDVADTLCQDLKISGVVQSLKPLEGGEHIRSADADTVIFQHNDVPAICKAGTDIFAQLITAGNGIGCDVHTGADLANRGKQICRTIEKATSAGGWACSTAFRSGRIL